MVRCKYCNKKFNRLDNMNRHMKICKVKMKRKKYYFKNGKENKYKEEIKD